jgi:lipopolysaccharide transport system ATP-binding protein
LSTVIKVENLSKSYLLRHQLNRSQYSSLRDVISEKVKNVFSKNNHKVHDTELFWALKNISFNVKDGERIGIIGRNGAGKSTLLKILSRITDPSTGKVSIRGRVASLLEVGTGFHPELSGRENIYLNGAILGMGHGEIKNKFDEIVAFAEVEKFLDTPVKRYSSGMYVRLAFAVAAHLEPEILIVDEVLAVGDAQFQRKCLGKMQDVSRNGRTILFVSHNMAAIQNLCNKCIYLKDGMIQKEGNSSDVISEYLKSAIANIADNLDERTDRKGNGAIRIISVNIKDDSNRDVSALQCGSNGKFCIHFKINAPVLKNFHLSVGIDDETGQRITNLSNEATNDFFSSIKGVKGTIEIQLKRIPLRRGTYTFTIYSTANGEITDWIQNAGTFNVESGDFYMTGRLPSEGQGSFLVDHSFEYIND